MNISKNEMPSVLGCNAAQCAYNTAGACHAKAITVGDELNPECDTFFLKNTHVKNTSIVAGVGACKVSGCKHNQDYECTAEAIRVGARGRNIKCLSYEAR